jgi:hypothetical protein
LRRTTEGPELETNALEALVGRFAANIDRYFQVNIQCAQVLRMTARPAVKPEKKKSTKKAPKSKPAKKTGK